MKQVCVSSDVDAEQKQVDNGMIFGSFEGVKGQSNLEIAGSSRNILRYSVHRISVTGGRALIELWGSKTLLLSRKLRIPYNMMCVQSDI